MLQLNLKPSRIESGLVSSSHFCALFSLYNIELGIMLWLVPALLIVGSLLRYCLADFSLAEPEGAEPEGTRSENPEPEPADVRLTGPGSTEKGARRVAWHKLSRRSHRVMLGQQHGLLQIGAREVMVSLPRISYYSEFLIVLSFDPYLAPVAPLPSWQRLTGSMKLVFWPDSLSRADDRRLRRYLRFDCPRLAGVVPCIDRALNK